MEEANNNDQTTRGEYHPNHEVVLSMQIEVEKNSKLLQYGYFQNLKILSNENRNRTVRLNCHVAFVILNTDIITRGARNSFSVFTTFVA
jgi:hypothetical protein